MRVPNVRPLALALALATTASPLLAQEVDTVLMSAEFRGIHAVNDRVLWASGSRGVIANSIDGRSWRFDILPGADSLFLVDVWAKDANKAWVVGTDFRGGYAAIFHTEDGGRVWTKQWELRHADAFLDGITCSDAKHCVALGDPHEGNFLILITDDGGESWTRVAPASLPARLENEAAFAASGTEITSRGKKVWFVTGGGHHARVWRSTDRGETWQVSETPLAAGTSAGLFGIAMENDKKGFAAGGDYQLPSDSAVNLFRTTDGGESWTAAGRTTPIGVRWGLVHAGGKKYVATSPTGTGITTNDGRTWTLLEGGNTNTATCAKKVCWLAGKNRIVRVELR